MTSNLELVFLTKFIILFITEEFVQMFRFVVFGVICWNCTNSAPAEQISKTGGVFFIAEKISASDRNAFWVISAPEVYSDVDITLQLLKHQQTFL